MASHILEEVDDVVLIHKAHLAVNLSKLRLTVGTQVLITEALSYLEVAVETSHHQELLQGLRALRESVELTRVHARWNHEVARTLWSTTNEDRSLHLHEVLAIEEVANQDAHTVTKLQVLAHSRAAQVQVTILHSDIVTAIGVIFYSEWRGLAL